jgi:hypothetical protein
MDHGQDFAFAKAPTATELSTRQRSLLDKLVDGARMNL